MSLRERIENITSNLVKEQQKIIESQAREIEALKQQVEEKNAMRKEWRKDFYDLKKEFEGYRQKMHRLHPNHICDYDTWNDRP